ncbi:MAG: hypothetical protein GY946_02230, partial [bacterium]|nr:hypothetical protein [bacterium]
MTAVLLLALFLVYRADVGAERARLLTQEAAIIQAGVHLVERGLEITAADLSSLADLIGGAQAPDSASPLERNALAFLRPRPGYHQV